ncbi:hypothetical protein [Streptomyces sp. N2A]|uniref:hypothetical protein n=1 Tax=Streptomyces sp. N2A TaxID=3073936 RepID=UPI0028703DC2|nr:hypothetical protein [Streptomyces sp. N2A]
MVRPADMLVVDITLVGLHFDGARHRLVRAPNTPNAFILVGLPPQHVVEEVPDNLSNVTAPMQAVTAGSSRLAFSVPADIKELELSLDGLLDWERLVPLRVPDDLRGPDTPGTTVFQGVPRSIIEFPTRLLISYDEPVDWLGGARPQQADGRTALWHARLHPALDGARPGAPDGGVKLRAFATVTNGGTLPPGAPYTAIVLQDLVTLTSRFPLTAGTGETLEVHSAPLRAEQFLLTPMGTSAHLHGAWEPLSDAALTRYDKVHQRPPGLVAYDHITGLGRDQYVRIVRHGHLCTGHEALHMQEYRRLFIARPDDGIVAYLQREDRIIVKQPEKTYGAGTGFEHDGREMPFRVLRITDRVTPVIIPPDVPPNPPLPPEMDKPDVTAFWVRLKESGDDHEFTLIGTDSEGRKVSFTMPLVWVPDGAPNEQQQLKDLYDPGKENKPEEPDKMDKRQRRELHGQVMAMAEPPTGAAGSTSHAVGFLTFRLGPKGKAPVVAQPCVEAAELRVPAVEQFIPNAGNLKVGFNDTYLRQTMEGHPAGAYLDLETPLNLAFGAQQAGGLSSPNAAVKLITSRAGVLPEIFKSDQAIDAITDAEAVKAIKEAFGGAQLLGIDLSPYLNLKKLVKGQLGTLRQLGDDEIAKILGDTNRLLPAPVLRMRDLADEQGKELRYVWKPPLERPPGGLIDVSEASLVLDARTVRSKDAIDKSTVQGSLTHFALDFLGMARVEFKELKFKTGPGQKPDVAASGVELKFRGPLEFINTLRSALPAEAFGPGAYIDVQPTGIRAGYKLAVPAMPLGVFNLANLALSAELAIPFDGQPVSFRFSVSEQKHPFTLTVSLFGGGGYFSLLLDATGVKEAEGAIEFGGAAALDLGVASGGVSIMAGIRFMLAKGDIKLTGYLRCNGFLTVLGIVTVTVEFYLELTYEKKGKQSIVRGRGTLTVSVRIAFFSKSVSLELERTFAGAPVDPTFAQCFSKEQDWPEYCAAFAA